MITNYYLYKDRHWKKSPNYPAGLKPAAILPNNFISANN